MVCDNGHKWSKWYQCIKPDLEYRVCYNCLHKQIESVATPTPRWVEDHRPKK